MTDAWEIEEDDYGDELWYGGDGCGLICVNGWTNGGCKKNPEEWEDLKKQARLISVAPILLKALTDLVRNNDPEHVLAAKVAIAKATGEEK